MLNSTHFVSVSELTNLRASSAKLFKIVTSASSSSIVAALDRPDEISSSMSSISSCGKSSKSSEKSLVSSCLNCPESLAIFNWSFNRSYLLFNGQILKSGTSEFLANDKEAKRLYLGEKFRLD